MRSISIFNLSTRLSFLGAVSAGFWACGVAALTSSVSGKLVVNGFEPRLHDRFYVGADRAFIGEGHEWSREGDWSGAGKRPDPNFNNYIGWWSLTMISERHFLTSYHARPHIHFDEAERPLVRFFRDDDPNGEFWEGTVHFDETAQNYDGVRIGLTDMWLGHLDETPPEWVRRYPLVKRNTATNWASYLDPTVFLFGQGAEPLGYTNVLVGRNEIETRVGGIMSYDVQSPPGLGADEARIGDQDSGSPIFAITPAGPALFGISATSFGNNPTMPEYFGQIQDLLLPGEHVRIVTDLSGDLDADYDVDQDDEAIFMTHFPKVNGASYFEGDLNRNGTVDAADRVILDQQLGKLLTSPADFNKNFVVDPADFPFIANHWLSPVEPLSDGDVTGDGVVDREDVIAFEVNRVDVFNGTPLIQIEGDANFDGVVSNADFQLWAENFPGNEPGSPYEDGDATGDGLVGMEDLAVIRMNNGKIFADVNGDSTVNIADIDVIVDPVRWQLPVTGGRADGDLNLDNVVNELDLAAVGEFLGFTYRIPLPQRNIGIVPGDFDGDFDIDGGDFLALQRWEDVATDLATWGRMFGVPGAAFQTVPEPSAALLFAALLPLGMSKRLKARLA